LLHKKRARHTYKQTDKRKKEARANVVDQKRLTKRDGGLGSRPKKMYGERLGDGVEYHLMKPTTRR